MGTEAAGYLKFYDVKLVEAVETGRYSGGTRELHGVKVSCDVRHPESDNWISQIAVFVPLHMAHLFPPGSSIAVQVATPEYFTGSPEDEAAGSPEPTYDIAGFVNHDLDDPGMEPNPEFPVPPDLEPGGEDDGWLEDRYDIAQGEGEET